MILKKTTGEMFFVYNLRNVDGNLEGCDYDGEWHKLLPSFNYCKEIVKDK